MFLLSPGADVDLGDLQIVAFEEDRGWFPRQRQNMVQPMSSAFGSIPWVTLAPYPAHKSGELSANKGFGRRE